MTRPDPSVSSLPSRVTGWFPRTVTRPVRILAWASFVLQVVLIGTGGAVRLTASGLGCPTWPQCTAGSLVNTPELGFHGIIEFGNRLLTVVLTLVVIAMFLAVLRLRVARRDLFWLALVQGLSIPFQAVLGGLTVLSGLNPYVVGLHFVVSIGLVILTVVLVYRVYHGRRMAGTVVPRWFGVVTAITAVFAAITVVFGILTTGSGPHAGDNSDAKALAPRNGLDPLLLQHIHSWPAYVTFGLTVVLVIGSLVLGNRIGNRSVRRFAIALLVVEILQIIVGITQAENGLPIVLVNIHLVLAAMLIAALAALILSQQRSTEESVRPLKG
ncbi:MAG: heme synthase [Glaciihabitans sp.]|nr:heme synthase [Glaciihabitans sp.]